ncbi:MAG: RNase P subunit p30 family protein [archaeon]
MKDLNLFRVKDSVYLKIVSSKDEALGDLNCNGILIRGDEKVARSIIASLKDKKFDGKVGIFGGDDAFNRRVVESLKVDYLVSIEKNTKFDNLKQRDSGLNHVVAKIAKDKGVKIVVNFGEIARLKGKEKGERIAKIMQNVGVCRKVGCGILIGSFALDKKGVVDVKGRQSFGVTLGMSSSEVRDCVEF